MNIFERAVRRKLRFKTPSGTLQTEQLFDLPLTHSKSTSLDGLAQGVNNELQTMTTSFVSNTTPDNRRQELELMLEILKHVIKSKESDIQRVETAQETAAKKQRLMEALAAKQDQKLTEMSEEELKKELANIG